MTRSSPPQLSFSSGEISPLLHARHDYQRFQTGLAACRGFIPLRQGGITRAPGTWYRGNTRANAQARLIAFQFAANDAVVLEFTALRMRVWRYGALIEASPGVPYELTTPYDLAAIRRLQWVQSADVIYLVDGARPMQKLSRFALDNWTIADADITTGPFRIPNLDPGITVQASAAAGTVTLTGTGNPFAADMVGGLMLIEPVDMTAVALWTGNQAVAVGDLIRYGDNIYALTAGTNTGANPPIHTEGTRKYDHVNGTSWAFMSDSRGIVRITGFTNANSVTATVLRRLPVPVITGPTWKFSLGAWSDRHGYPATIEIYDQRLVAAATPSDPRTVWLSAAGSFDDYLPSTEPDGSFAYAIAGRQSLNRILWLSAGQRALHIGALGEEYSTRSTAGGTAIGPTNAAFGFDSSYGSLDQRPIAPDGRPIFITRDGARIIELAYDFQSDANQPRELTLPSEHIGQDGLLELAWQSSPLRLCWARRAAGDLAVMVYDPTEDVLGWATYPVAGGAVESMAVTANADGSADILTLVVRRTIDGAVIRTIEEQAVAYGIVAGDDPIDRANHLFCAQEFDPPTEQAQFTVAHLPNTEVYAWTDKGQFGPLTTNGAGLVDLGFPVGRAIIGLHDGTQRAETLDIAAPARDGSSQGRKKRLHPGTGIVLHRTAGGSARAKAWDFGRPPMVGSAQDLLPVAIGTDATAAWSGATQLQLVTHAAAGASIEILPDGAKPLTVLAVIPRIEEVG